MLLGGLDKPVAADGEGGVARPISPADFAKWYEASDTKHRAILLVMLNASMRPQDLALLPLSAIDLSAGTLVTRRRKQGRVIRCAVLWQRTIEAIRAYQQSQPHDYDRVFVNDNGTPYASGRVVAHMLRKFRTLGGVAETVHAEHIRDGAYTAAISAGVDLMQAKVLAGHRVGIPDDYIARGAHMVADACEAIERHYFGKEKKGKGGK